MKKIIIAALLLPVAAFAQDAIPVPQASSPVPIMENMVGALAGQLATTQARLQDANLRIQQLDQALKAAQAKAAKDGSAEAVKPPAQQ